MQRGFSHDPASSAGTGSGCKDLRDADVQIPDRRVRAYPRRRWRLGFSRGLGAWKELLRSFFRVAQRVARREVVSD
jgi:hypothetical protein